MHKLYFIVPEVCGDLGELEGRVILLGFPSHLVPLLSTLIMCSDNLSSLARADITCLRPGVWMTFGFVAFLLLLAGFFLGLVFPSSFSASARRFVDESVLTKAEGSFFAVAGGGGGGITAKKRLPNRTAAFCLNKK